MRRRSVAYHSRLDADPVMTGWALALACLLNLALVLLLFPPARRDQPVEDAAMRFGYEGPTQFMREIRVRLSRESLPSAAANRMIGSVRRIPDAPTGESGRPKPIGGRRGGGQGGLSSRPGKGQESLLGSLLGLRPDVPTVQSEDLIIITLIRPDYPEVAIQQGIEGRVELLALVNERGLVEEVRILHSAGRLLDGAASSAVRRCRFEPYRVNGQPKAVYANFKFNFTLVERPGSPLIE